MKRKDHLRGWWWLATALVLLELSSCQLKSTKKTGIDTPAAGTIYISVDESFRPVMEEQIAVYEALHPGTHIIAAYKSEANCLRDLFTDTLNRMVIITRGLTSAESRIFHDSLGYSPVNQKIASDGITLVVNKNSQDSVFSLQQLRDYLSGQGGTPRPIVFDGLNATSTVRYAIDSILRGGHFDTSVVKAVPNSAGVLHYVADHPDAIGMVGFSWIGNPEDTAQLNLLKKIKIAWVECSYCKDSPYVKPTQASIMSKRYPLVRGLYYILKENYSGLGSGFGAFLQYERGQLIFRRSYLAPEMNFGIRSVEVSEKL
ncbi:MAG: substrate-binding domain-containing protein [Ferruginibacter sp.]